MQAAAPAADKLQTPPNPVSPVKPTPLSIRSSSSLTEDFISRQDLLLSPGASSLALYRNQLKGGLIEGAVALENSYQTLTRDADGSTWQLVKFEGDNAPTGCSEVVSIVYPDGARGVVAATPDWTYFFEITEDGPKYVNSSTNTASNLKIAYTPPLPQRVPLLYGASANGNLLLGYWINATNFWHQLDLASVDVGGSLSGGNFALATLNGNDHVLLNHRGRHCHLLQNRFACR